MKCTSKQSRQLAVRESGEQLALGFKPVDVSIADIMSPTGYRGLSAFHKYWGKKPIECLGFLIDTLTQPNDIVVDPFVGSGLIARECALRKRRFIGVDLNPVSIQLARMISDLPALEQYDSAVQRMGKSIRARIDESYVLADRMTATHYLWDGDRLKQVWTVHRGKGGREIREPTPQDISLSASYASHTSSRIRPLRLYQNSRINTSPTLALSDIFTGRALRNIDLIIESIPETPESLRRALFLTLTASIGQMSRMVFAITRRGKTTGKNTSRTEVGSWVIGYWRPSLHFEINVWNCFQHRAAKLVRTLSSLGQARSFKLTDSPHHVFAESAQIALLNTNAITALRDMPNSSVALVLTDPPHSDRIPYLELSELWNAVLGETPLFEEEIVVSNARGRGKTKAEYNKTMCDLLREVDRVLVPDGVLALLFNARDAHSWNGLIRNGSEPSLVYCGCFPMVYSANSVVQDNRAGSMKSDYVLLYRKRGRGGNNGLFEERIHSIPGWSEDFPKAKGE